MEVRARGYLVEVRVASVDTSYSCHGMGEGVTLIPRVAGHRQPLDSAVSGRLEHVGSGPLGRRATPLGQGREVTAPGALASAL